MVTEMKFQHILVKLVTKPLSLLSHRYFKISNQQVDNLISQHIIFLIRHCSQNDCLRYYSLFPRLEKTITRVWAAWPVQPGSLCLHCLHLNLHHIRKRMVLQEISETLDIEIKLIGLLFIYHFPAVTTDFH